MLTGLLVIARPSLGGVVVELKRSVDLHGGLHVVLAVVHVAHVLHWPVLHVLAEYVDLVTAGAQ